MRIVSIFVLLFLLVSGLHAEPLTIVAYGQPRATLVATANEPKADKAALKLQESIARISGAALPLIKEGHAVPAGMKLMF